MFYNIQVRACKTEQTLHIEVVLFMHHRKKLPTAIVNIISCVISVVLKSVELSLARWGPQGSGKLAVG